MFIIVLVLSMAEPVSVSLYYESFCPGCQGFILKELYPAVQNISSIMNVTLVPYGNAKTSGKEVKCQHGEEECEGNMWENCAIKLNPEFSDYFPFIHCMEKASSKMLDEVRRCARTSGLEYGKLEECYKFEGKSLLIEAGKRTPTHSYVPWVEVDGKHSTEAENNLVKTVCELYKGEKPQGCSEDFLLMESHNVETCPDNEKECAYAPGKFECCLPGEYCIPKCGCCYLNSELLPFFEQSFAFKL